MVSTVSSTVTAPVTTTSPADANTSDTDTKSMLFQYALSAALNAPHVLGDGGGDSVDDDDSDGSSLTVGMSI